MQKKSLETFLYSIGGVAAMALILVAANFILGGMRQRAMIALALSCDPSLLLADEPTTALDATVQIQVLLLIRELQRDLDLGVIFVTHDIGVAVEVSDRIGVMYAGKLVEISTVRQMFTEPYHPYSQALIHSLPNLDNKGVLQGIPGLAPSLLRIPSGCAFHPRCSQATERCASVVPSLRPQADGRFVSCLLYEEDKVTA